MTESSSGVWVHAKTAGWVVRGPGLSHDRIEKDSRVFWEWPVDEDHPDFDPRGRLPNGWVVVDPDEMEDEPVPRDAPFVMKASY